MIIGHGLIRGDVFNSNHILQHDALVPFRNIVFRILRRFLFVKNYFVGNVMTLSWHNNSMAEQEPDWLEDS